MKRALILSLGTAAAFLAGWAAGRWSRDPAPQPASIPAKAAPEKKPRLSPLDSLLAAHGGTAQLNELARWSSLPVAELEALWRERERFPEDIRRAALRHLVAAWLDKDAPGACAAVIPLPASERINFASWGVSNSELAFEADFQGRKLTPVLLELALEWTKQQPARTAELDSVLWPYCDDEDDGWDGQYSAEALARLMPERFLAAMSARHFLHDSANAAIVEVAKTNPARASQLAVQYDVDKDQVLEGWVQTRPDEAFAEARRLAKEGDADAVAYSLLATWLRKDQAAARAWLFAQRAAGTLPEYFNDAALSEEGEAAFEQSWEAARDWCSRQQPDDVTDGFRERIASAAASSSPDESAQLMGMITDDFARSRTADKVVEAQLRRLSPEEVSAWCARQPESVRSKLTAAFLSSQVRMNPALVLKHPDGASDFKEAIRSAGLSAAEAMPYFKSLPAEWQKAYAPTLASHAAGEGDMAVATELYAQAIAAKDPLLNNLPDHPPDPAALLECLRQATQGIETAGCFSRAFRNWIDSAPEAASAWLTHQTQDYPSRARQAMQSQAVQSLADSDPLKAAAWAAKNITDREARVSALHAAFQPLSKVAPHLLQTAAAQAGLTAEEQQQVLRRNLR